MVSEYRILFKLFNRDENIKFVLILFMTLIAMVLEIFGLSMVVPIIASISSESFFIDYPIIKNIFEFLGKPEKQTFIGYMLAFLCVYFLFKNIFLLILTKMQINLGLFIRTRLSYELFELYLNQPFEIQTSTNSSEMIRNIISECGRVSGVVINLLTIITEVLICAGIISLMIFFEPKIIIVILFTISFGLIFILFTNKNLSTIGRQRLDSDESRLRYLQEGFNGYKELKLLNKLNFFLGLFSKENNINALSAAKSRLISQLPRFFLEIIGIISIASLYTLLFLNDYTLESILVILTLFAAGTFKMIPSINKILSSYSTLAFSFPGVKTTYDQFITNSNSKIPEKMVLSNKEFKFNREIEFKNVTFSYVDNEIISDLSIKINKGEFIGIIGESGSGKTTFIHLLAGLLKPSKGMILVDGVDINNKEEFWYEYLGYVSQNIFVFDDTLKKNIIFDADENEVNNELYLKSLQDSRLDSVFNFTDKEKFLGEKGSKLSGGQAQRVGIARALFSGKEVLILDEPTSSLDSDLEKELIGELDQLKGKKTIFIVSHRENSLKSCDRIFNISNGFLEEVVK